MGKKKRSFVIEIASVILLPISIYWILSRQGITGVLDALAVGVVVGSCALWAFKWLAEQKVITFGK